MSTRLGGILLFAGVAATLSGQDFPWYLSDHYPARGATGVPTSISIMLEESRAVIEGAYPTGIAYSLKSQAGAVTALQNPNVYWTAVSITPASPLAASTRYTFTITPPATLGDPYSFDFTTGSGPDRTAPQLIGFDPPSGTYGTSVTGPFTARFNERLLNTSLNGGVAVRVPGGYSAQQVGITLAPDGMGVEIRPLPLSNSWNAWPAYQITVDPTQFRDASGNAGQGPPQTAQYLTWAAPNTSGPALTSFFPADGDSGLPVNVSIRLLFSHPIDSATAAAGVTLDDGGATVPVRVNSFASGYGVELKPPNLLAPNRLYRVTVNPALLDQAGLKAQAAGFQFTTGGDADVTPAQSVEVGPPSGTNWPPNVPVWLRANKRIMPLSVVEYSTIGSPQSSGGAPVVAGTASLSSDGKTFTFVPATQPVPGQSLSVGLADVVDFTGAPFNQQAGYVAGAAADHDPPTVLAVSPPDGSQGVSATAPIQVAFGEPISVALSGDFPQLSANGQRVPVEVKLAGSVMTVTSPNRLDADTNYTLDLSGATDMAGNTMGPYQVQFVTGAAASSTGTPKLLSTSPQANADGVDVNTAISFTFDAPLSPLAAISGFTVSDSVFGAYPAAATVADGTLTIKPAHPLLHDSAIRVTVTTTDIAGRYASAQILFRTGPYADSSPFQVTAVSPPDGATINSADSSITLTFSKAVNPASLTSSAITVYSNGHPVQPKIVRSNQDVSLVVRAPVEDGSATLVVDPELTDITGNPAIPFRAAYTFSSAYLSTLYRTSVKAMRPPPGSSGVPANTAISLFFSKPVDLAAMRASLVVVADGLPAAGTMELSADRTTLTFRPTAPFPTGAQVHFFQRTFLFEDFYGAYTFTVAPAPPEKLAVVRYAPSGGGPANAVIEVEFSAEIATGGNLVSLHLPGYPGPGPAVPTTESHPRVRVIRLTPVSPLATGSYVIVVSPKIGGGPFGLQITAAVKTPTPVLIAGPIANATGVPLNASVRAAFNVPLNPLSALPANLTIQSGGRTIPSVLYLAGDNRSLVLTPTEALPPDAPVNVALSGMEDQFGNSVPAKSWSFTTGPGPDFSLLTLVQSSIPSTYPVLEIPANTAAVFQFDRALDPQVLTAQNLHFNPPVTTQATLSDDLRTLTYTPVPAWAKGQQYSLYLPQVADLAGNETGGSPSTSFSVAFDTDLTPPQLLAASPADGQAGMPLNTQLIAAFDKPVRGDSFGRIRLMMGDVSLPLVAMPDDLQRARLAPATPLLPQTTYTFVVEGVRDLSGNAMAGSVTRTFTTGDFMDASSPNAVVYGAAATNIPIRVLSSEPLSPATVDSRTIRLNKASAIASSYYWIPVPATPVLSGDGLGITLTPRDPLIPGWPYQVVVGTLRDFAGNPATSSNGPNMPGATFTAGYGPDTTAPVATIVPADGSTDVPLNTRLGVIFSKPYLSQPVSSILRVTADGHPISGSFQSGSLYFTPDMPLTPGTTYRIDVASVIDAAGNVSSPASSTFTTTSSAAPGYTSFQLLSTTPANGDVGVPVDSPIVLNFNRQVDPTTVGAIAIFTSFPVNGSFTTSGRTVTFTPTEPWPSAASVNLIINTRFNTTVTDLAGNGLAYSPGLYFKAAAAPDPTPPELLSVSPESGTLLVPPSVTFRLSFTKTVATGSGGIVIFNGSQQGSATVSYAPNDPHTLVVSANVPANSQITLIGTDAIVDRAGNPVTPFSFQYPTGTAEVSERPTVTSVTPNTGAANVGAQTPIVLHFNKTMDPQSLAKAVRVTQDGENFAGKLDTVDSNRGVQFTPASPYKAGSRIDIFVLETAADPAGLTLYQRYNSFFTVAGGTAPFATADQTGFGGSVAPDAVLEVAFDRPIDPKTITPDNVWLRVGRRRLAGDVSLRGDRIVRLAPSAPMEISREHALTLGPGLRAADGTPVRPEEFHFAVQPEAPAAGVTAVEVTMRSGKAAVLVRFSGPVNPLSLDAVRLMAGDGAEIAADRHISLDYRDVWLVPRDTAAGEPIGLMELLGRSVRVRLEEMPDRAGRRMKPGTHQPANLPGRP
jgi:hypothetical protein